MFAKTMMKLEIPTFVPATQSDFVSFWCAQYQYDLERLYDDNIGKLLNEDRVWALYKWKNVSEKIAAGKQKSIRTAYIPELTKLPSLSTIQDGQKYIRSLTGGVIWDIFWLHCIKPDLFPIFDQHSYRSMAHIMEFSTTEIPPNRVQKLDAYFNKYIPFTKQFPETNQRDLDKALFAYGRFLRKGFSGK